VQIPFTPDSCLRQLNVSYDIMLLIAEMFEVLLLPFKTVFSGRVNENFIVPPSANDLLTEMESLERHYFNLQGIDLASLAHGDLDNFFHYVKWRSKKNPALFLLFLLGTLQLTKNFEDYGSHII